MRVLVLEEAAPIRDRLVAMLAEALDVEVVGEAPSSERGRAARALAPDVVVVDVHARLAGGLDLLGELKRGDGAPMIVVLTNHADDHHRKLSISRGADFFFDKSKDLSSVVEVLLAHRARIAAPPRGEGV